MVRTLELCPILLALLLLLVGRSDGRALHSRPQRSADSPPIWGGALQWSCVVNMTDPADSPSNPHWFFNYTYDATGQNGEVDRYDHSAGQADETCKVKSVPTGDPCQVLNAADGNTYVIGNPGSPSATCCIFPIHVGAVRSDWLSSGGSYVGRQTINDIPSQVWTITGQYVNFYASEIDDESNRPVRFWEHKKGILKQWDFVLETFQAQAQPEGTFEPPEVCGDKPPLCRF